MGMLLSLLLALALTLAVECPAMLALAFRGRLGAPEGRAVYAALLCNLLTNPLLNLLLRLAAWLLGAGARLWLVHPLELAVVAGEAALYRALLGWRAGRALWVSLVLNALSFGTGVLLFGL